MASVLGLGIGTVNVVSALVTEESALPVVRTRRTAVGFDDANSPRLCGVAQLPMAVTDFADLNSDPESITVGGRLWSPTNLIAALIRDSSAAVPSATDVVATYPASYSAKQVALMRQAMELSGVGYVDLVSEPVAATYWLEHEHGPLAPGYVLVYDLGGTGLDVTVVRVGAGDHAILGIPQRCYDFGGRQLGEMIARCSDPVASAGSVSSLGSFVDKEGLRAEQIRDSLDVVRSTVESAGIGLSDIGHILLVGGAARPPQVARTLAELGLPVVMSADPAHSVACGAAVLGARNTAAAPVGRAKRAPIFSGAAVFSAVAMSAATMLGNGAVSPENMPATGPLPNNGSGQEWYNNLHERATVDRGTNGSWSVSYDPPQRRAYTTPVPAGYSRPFGPPMIENDDDTYSHDPGTRERGTYSDPARFANPIPFAGPAPQVEPPQVRNIPTRPEQSRSGSPDGRLPVLPSHPTIDPPAANQERADVELSPLPWRGGTDDSDSSRDRGAWSRLPQRPEKPDSSHAERVTPWSTFTQPEGDRESGIPESGMPDGWSGSPGKGAPEHTDDTESGSTRDGSHSRTGQRSGNDVIPDMRAGTIPGSDTDNSRYPESSSDAAGKTPGVGERSKRTSTSDVDGATSSRNSDGTLGETDSRKDIGFGSEHSFSGAEREPQTNSGFERSRSGDRSSGASPNPMSRGGRSRDASSKTGASAGTSLGD